MAKPKRISNIVFHCSKHGKFVGYQWGGHRRICKAAPADSMTATAKPAPVEQKRAATASITMLNNLKNHLFDLDTEIEKNEKGISEAKSHIERLAAALNAARGEKAQIIATIKEMV